MPAVTSVLECIQHTETEHCGDDNQIERTATFRVASSSEEDGEQCRGEDQAREQVCPGNEPGREVGPLDLRRIQIGYIGK